MALEVVSMRKTASKIAVETVAKLIKEQFPPFVSDDQTYFSVIRAAMHGAANAIERYVEKMMKEMSENIRQLFRLPL